MRSKKRILIIGGDTPDRASISCALRVHQYHVIQADGPRDESLATLAAPDLLLVLWPVGVKPLNMLHKRLENLAGFPIPLVMIAPAAEESNTLAVHADATLATNTTVAELLERIKFIAVRKRGPHFKKIPEDTVKSIFELKSQGFFQREIAARMNLAQSTVNRVLHRRKVA